jgi:16S rRNA (guanine527-N7)-methyltransferase
MTGAGRPEVTDSIEAVRAIVSLSRETAERLSTFVALIRKWQPAENLVSGKTLPEIWERHVADCAQMVPLFPDARRWMDVGTGAGFPGMVIAILLAETEGAQVHLVESNRRKCAFLRQAVHATDTAATVREGRAEDIVGRWNLAHDPVDRLVARAVAPLANLIEMTAPLLEAGVPAAFLKGEDSDVEIAAAAHIWDFDLVRHPSRTRGGGVILDIAHVRRKAESG